MSEASKLLSTNPGHFSLVRNFHLADVITILNGVCGALSIFSSMRYLLTGELTDLWMAMSFIPLGFTFDVLDGRVARWRKQSSLLGQEMDSLADLLSFGMAPAVLAFAYGMCTLIDTIVLTYFVACGIARLARYNATVALLPKDASGKVAYFEGTPIPTTLSLVAAIAYFVHRGSFGETLPWGKVSVTSWAWAGNGLEVHPLVALFAISGTLMISKTLRIPKP